MTSFGSAAFHRGISEVPGMQFVRLYFPARACLPKGNGSAVTTCGAVRSPAPGRYACLLIHAYRFCQGDSYRRTGR